MQCDKTHLPRGTRWLIAALATLLAVLGVGVALASADSSDPGTPISPPTPEQLAALGADPTASAAEPGSEGTLPDNQPLISVQWVNGQAVSISGTAVAPGEPDLSLRRLAQRNASAPAANGITVLCHVNFTRSRARALPKGASKVTYYGGIGCPRTMLLFGQAFLLQDAKTYLGFGNYAEGFMQSYASGERDKYVSPGENSTQRSLYIRHLTNVYFPNRLMTGVITIKPTEGTPFDKASSKCELGPPHTIRGVTYKEGLHCDFYSTRF